MSIEESLLSYKNQEVEFLNSLTNDKKFISKYVNFIQKATKFPRVECQKYVEQQINKHVKSKFQLDEKDVKTLDELITTCQVDTNKWDVTDFSVTKSDGSNKDGTLVPKFQVRANFELKKDKKVTDILLDNFIQEAKKHSPIKFNYNKKKKDGDKLYVINLFDLHLAKYAWGQQTGEDYDIKIATKIYKDAVDYFFTRIKNIKIDRILFPIGNDFFNYDREASGGKGGGGTLTYAGTAVDSDSRWQKMFQIGCQLIVEAVEKLSTIAPVDVVVVIANHDETISQYLGYYLSAWFKNNKRVNINNTPKTRKYYLYGKNLLGFVHSHMEKIKDLPLIMAREVPEYWGQTNVRDWFLSHWHQENLQEFNGVRIRISPALCGQDFYHYKHGFIGNNRAGQGFLYQKSGGLLDIHYFNV